MLNKAFFITFLQLDFADSHVFPCAKNWKKCNHFCSHRVKVEVLKSNQPVKLARKSSKLIIIVVFFFFLHQTTTLTELRTLQINQSTGYSTYFFYSDSSSLHWFPLSMKASCRVASLVFRLWIFNHQTFDTIIYRVVQVKILCFYYLPNVGMHNCGFHIQRHFLVTSIII